MKRGRRQRTLTEQGARRKRDRRNETNTHHGDSNGCPRVCRFGCAPLWSWPQAPPMLVPITGVRGTPRRGSLQGADGNTISVPVHPAWDLNVCHTNLGGH